jgi:hypothetical protein
MYLYASEYKAVSYRCSQEIDLQEQAVKYLGACRVITVRIH